MNGPAQKAPSAYPAAWPRDYNVINSQVVGRVLILGLISGYGVFVPQLRGPSWRS